MNFVEIRPGGRFRIGMVAQEPAPSSIGDEDDVYAPEELASMRAYSLARPSVARIRVAGRGISAQGTGFLLHGLADGHIVTNAHVVAGGTHFTASFLLPDELNLDAVLVGVDKVRDIAVLRVRADALPAASRPLRSSRNAARVGQRVHVLGAPFGLSHSFTTGVISATGREISVREGRVPLFDALQTGRMRFCNLRRRA